MVVIEWLNAGGFSVFDVREFDGILFAFHVRFAVDDGCTRLDKWAIKRHVMLPHPLTEVVERMFSRQPEARTKVKDAI